MAISLIAQTSGNTDNTQSVVLTKPTGTIDDDVLILLVSCDGTSGFVTPSGWTLFATQQTANTHTNQAFWKVADSEPASYDIGAAGNERAWACMITYRGASAITVIDSYNNSNVGTSGSDADIPSFTQQQMIV